MNTISCSTCHADVARDLWEDHHCPSLSAKPKLPVAGFLVRIEGGRLTIQTLGPLPVLGAVILGAQVFCEASFAMDDMAKALAYLLLGLEEMAE